jgi:hypothetical protein
MIASPFSLALAISLPSLFVFVFLHIDQNFNASMGNFFY